MLLCPHIVSGSLKSTGMAMMTDLIEAVCILEAALAAVAVIRRVGFVNVVVQSLLIFENESAVLRGRALEPVHGFFVFAAVPCSVGRPSLRTPVAFNLVGMVGGIVEMISNAVVVFEVTATTRISHCEG